MYGSRMTTIKSKRGNTPTPRQQQVLDFITSYLDNSGYPPSQREIARHLGVSGNLPAAKHLAALEKKGYLKLDGVNRGIALTSSTGSSVSLPIVGSVRAGHLSPAIEDILGYFSVDQNAVKGKSCFFLKVKGESMIDAGVKDGDLALIRPQQTAENRDMVVILVDGEATLKWFFKEIDHIRLQPDNPSMQPIIVSPDRQVDIVGKVIGLYRSLV
jgi:repressor LexA